MRNACAAFMERKGAKGVGLAGIVTAGAAVMMVIIGIWSEISYGAYWKTALSLVVVSRGTGAWLSALHA